MATNYLTFFNLKDDPFRLTPDVSYFYNSKEHGTALLSLEYCIRQREGFCLLTGEPGTGKTTVLRLLTEKWKDKAALALIMTPRLQPDEFFKAILDDFNIRVQGAGKSAMLKAFRDFLLAHLATNTPVAIIVDEAQQLPDATLEELRLLSNLETEKEKLLQIILIGQPELREKLLDPSLRQLNQRITVRVQIRPLSERETFDYIDSRLVKAGNSGMLFTLKAKEQIFELSGGIPRTINLLCSRSLMSAFLEGAAEVQPSHVKLGSADVMETAGPDQRSGALRRPRRPMQRRLGSSPPARALLAAAALLGIAAAVGAGFAYKEYFYSPQPAKVAAGGGVAAKPVMPAASSAARPLPQPQPGMQGAEAAKP